MHVWWYGFVIGSVVNILSLVDSAAATPAPNLASAFERIVLIITDNHLI